MLDLVWYQIVEDAIESIRFLSYSLAEAKFVVNWRVEYTRGFPTLRLHCSESLRH